LNCGVNGITLPLLHERDSGPRARQSLMMKDEYRAMMRAQVKRFYLFGVFRVDATERVLFGEKGVVPLTPKAFDTLLVLIKNSGHLLGKEELMAKVWPDSFVEENNLAQNISALRKALGGEDDGQKYIETVPKRGYRFVADVRESFWRAEGRPETGPNKMQAGCNERRHRKGKSFLRDVVIIGRAIDFK
jgi:DNA-binding winged helix-turn-helix (wHTH) protein